MNSWCRYTDKDTEKELRDRWTGSQTRRRGQLSKIEKGRDVHVGEVNFDTFSYFFFNLNLNFLIAKNGICGFGASVNEPRSFHQGSMNGHWAASEDNEGISKFWSVGEQRRCHSKVWRVSTVMRLATVASSMTPEVTKLGSRIG